MPDKKLTSVLEKISRADVSEIPFRHICVKNAINEELCDRLIAEFPSIEAVTDGAPCGSNKRFSYSASRILKDSRISPLWKDFIGRHVSQDFFDEVISLLGIHAFKNARVGLRYRDTFETADVLIDALVCVNTPVTEGLSAVRTAHVDDPRKIFAGLFYLRGPYDDSSGGDLELYPRNGERLSMRGQQVEAGAGTAMITVPYEKNTAVFFINSLDALHGVSIRGITPHPRLFVNFIAEARTPLFDIMPYQKYSLHVSTRNVLRNAAVIAWKAVWSPQYLLPVSVRRRLDPERFGIDRFMDFARRHVSATDRILDAGAGRGRYRDLFSHARYESTDFADAFHDGAKARQDFICDLSNIPRPDGFYDVVINTQVLEHIPDPESVVRELHRVLKPGGKLFLTTNQMWAVHGAPYNFFFFTHYGLRHIFERVGFSHVSIRPRGGVFWFLGKLFYELPHYIFHQYIFGGYKRSIRFKSIFAFSVIAVICLPFYALAAYIVIPLCLLFFYLDRFDKQKDFTLGYSCYCIK